MNITDIDDKIIKRARTDYLYEKYMDEWKNRPIEDVLQDTKAALEQLIKKVQVTYSLTPPGWAISSGASPALKC